MTKPLTIDALTHFADVYQAAPELAATSAGQELFCTLVWFDTLSTHGFARDARLHLLLGRDSSGRPGLLPLAATHGLTSLGNYYSSLYGPVLCDPSSLTAMLDFFFTSAAARR